MAMRRVEAFLGVSSGISDNLNAPFALGCLRCGRPVVIDL